MNFLQTSFINEEEAVNLPQQNRAEKNIDSRISKETATEEGSLKQQNREVSRTRSKRYILQLIVNVIVNNEVRPNQSVSPSVRSSVS